MLPAGVLGDDDVDVDELEASLPVDDDDEVSDELEEDPLSDVDDDVLDEPPPLDDEPERLSFL